MWEVISASVDVLSFYENRIGVGKNQNISQYTLIWKIIKNAHCCAWYLSSVGFSGTVAGQSLLHLQRSFAFSFMSPGCQTSCPLLWAGFLQAAKYMSLRLITHAVMEKQLMYHLFCSCFFTTCCLVMFAGVQSAYNVSAIFSLCLCLLYILRKCTFLVLV